jgi:hypothetical protein
MSAEIARYDGSFAVWSYTIGHGRLLLRRPKSAAFPTRVDILFKNVAWVSLPMNMEGLRIDELPMEEGGVALTDAGSMRTKDRKLFRVSGASWRGHVVAGVVVWHEDDREYNEPSPLLE